MKSNLTVRGMLSMYSIRARSSYFTCLVISCLFLIADAKSQVPTRISNQQQLVKKIYTSQIGVREKPSNSGLQVEKYLKYVNLPKGNPWCAAFVCWVLGEAGVGNPRSAWSPDLFRDRYIIWDREQGTRSKEQRPVSEPGTKNQESGQVAEKHNVFRSKSVVGTNPSGRYASPPRLATGNWLLNTDLPKSRPVLFGHDKIIWGRGERGKVRAEKGYHTRSGWSPGLFGDRYVVWGKGGESGKVRAEKGYHTRSGWSPGLFGERYVIWGKGAESGKLKACGAVGGVQRLPPGVSTCELFPDLFGDLVTTPGHQPQVSGAYLAVQNRANLGPQLRWRLLNHGNLQCTGDASCAASAGDPRSSRGRDPGAIAPLTGDIFGLFFPEKGRIAHTGFIDQWDGIWMISVEGNTNIAGSREGDGVYRKRRLVRSVYKVARYITY